jgi:hypothetical protein
MLGLAAEAVQAIDLLAAPFVTPLGRRAGPKARDLSALEGWDHQAAGTAEPNVFMEDWLLGAAMRHLDPGARVELFSAGGMGVLPLNMHARLLPPGMRAASVWKHSQSVDASAMVRHGDEAAFVAALVAHLRSRGVSLLYWPLMAADEPFARKLPGALAELGLGMEVVDRFERPQLCRQEGPAPLSGSRRRGLDRSRRRLRERGELAFRTVDPAESSCWIERFLTIESSGWKGDAGTALACSEAERGFFVEAARRGGAKGRLIIHALELDGEAIAMTVNFRAGDRVWAYKTAFDERFATFSPGVLAEAEGTLAMLADPTVGWVDACCAPDNKLMAELWPGRRAFQSVAIAVNPAARSMLGAVAAAFRLRRRWKRAG